MMQEYYFPERIADKFRDRFIKSTIRIGEDANFEGFFVNFPQEGRFRKILWAKLSPELGTFRVRALTPFPEHGFPVLPIVIPSWISPRVTVARVEGRIYDLSLFSGEHGRFVLASKIERMRMEDYLQMEKSGLHSKSIYSMFDSAFSELAKETFIPYFLSSPAYLKRVGGSALSLIASNSKHYATNFKPFFNMLSSISDILRKDRFKITMRYEDKLDLTIAPKFKIRYSSMNGKEARQFYFHRRARVWERSAITTGSFRAEELISLSDLPFIPTREETTIVDDSYLKEYIVDLGFYVLEKHLQNPEIDEEYVTRFKGKLIEAIEREFPDIMEAMQMGILMDIADVNGFGEHSARVMKAWERLGADNPLEPTIKTYLSIFERIEDIMGSKLREEIKSTKIRNRERKIINHVLWELNMLKPAGWDYRYFEEKLRERGIYRDAEKLLTQLRKDGYVIQKSGGKYLAISNL